MGQELFDTLVAIVETSPPRRGNDEDENMPIEDIRQTGDDFFAALRLLLNLDGEKPNLTSEGDAEGKMPLHPRSRTPPSEAER